MSERYSAWIKIGGSIERTKVESLLKAIERSGATLDWGDAPFVPEGPEDLLAVCEEGRLRLCDVEACFGEFEELEATCQSLELSYQRYTEASCGEDPILVDWRPGMSEPTVRTASNSNGDLVLVPEHVVREALDALEAGQVSKAIGKLKNVCTAVPDLPPFEIA